ncbi:MAG TPA: FmdB family zinc ribbon protein [Steroidobacteraceae bacterium]|nr:FmdB family zinc ribbon protein [Steroidobacteraceae bacterium]
MPFYEYQCKSCGHELEAMQKVSDAPLKKCPHCGKSQLTRLMSAPVFRLKGGGWYETDFKDKDNQRNVADRPEDSTKDKAAEAKPADDKGKESKAVDAKPDAAAKESSPAKEKADKPSEKASGDGSAKAGATKPKSRAATSKRKPIKVKRRR